MATLTIDQYSASLLDSTYTHNLILDLKLEHPTLATLEYNLYNWSGYNNSDNARNFRAINGIVLNSLAHNNQINFLVATLFPVRTNTFQNFSKDFFLPTVVNQAFKAQYVAKRPFVILASLALDVLTFPIRLLTCIPRILFNSLYEHPLTRYIKQHNLLGYPGRQFFTKEYVQIDLIVSADMDPLINGVKSRSYTKTLLTNTSARINLIQIPS